MAAKSSKMSQHFFFDLVRELSNRTSYMDNSFFPALFDDLRKKELKVAGL
jgi:hypothetical protein